MRALLWTLASSAAFCVAAGAQAFPEASADPAPGLLRDACSSPHNQSRVTRARLLLEQGEYRKAAQTFGAAADACVLDARVMVDYARALSLSGALGGAGDELVELAKRHRRAPAALLAIANVQLVVERFDEAVATAEQVLEQHPGHPQALKLQANALYLSGRDDEAKDRLIRALQAAPKDSEAPYMLGRIYYQEQLYQHAIPQFERVLALHGDSYKALDNLGLCYRGLGESDRAAGYFLRAIDAAKRQKAPYGWPYSNMAELMIEQGEFDKAYSLAFQAVEADPESARHFFLAGRALLAMGRAENSLRWLQRATELDPADPASHYQLARALRQAGRPDEAQAAFEKFREVRERTPARRR